MDSKIKVKIKKLRTTYKGRTARMVVLAGQMDLSNVDEAFEKINGLLQEFPQNLDLLFDIGEVTYVNSKSVGYLITLANQLPAMGGRMVIAEPQANVLDILNVMGVGVLIPMFDKVKAAKEAFLKPQEGTQYLN